MAYVRRSYILRLPDEAAKAGEQKAFEADMGLVKDFVPEIALVRGQG